MQKTIIGRYSANSATPFTYVPPLERMVSIFEYNNFVNDGLLANENNGASYVLLGTVEDEVNGVELSGFDRLGISAGFKTLLNDFNTIEGTYGIRLRIYYGEDNNSIDLDFSNKEMYGNTYNFKSYFNQEQVFDISGISNVINKIEIYLYQQGDFKDSNGNSIPYSTGLINLPNNILVNDLNLSIGYDVERFSMDTVLLYCLQDDLTYKAQDGEAVESKNIVARWIHKDEETGSFKSLSDLNNTYRIKWYNYEVGTSDIDPYGGAGWKVIGENCFSINFTPSIAKQSELVKAIAFIYDDNGEVSTCYTSESITFENKDYVAGQEVISLMTSAQIHCKDGSEGNYFIYNQNNKLNNAGEGTGKQRQFEFLWYGAKPERSIGLTQIRWLLPAEDTMIYLYEDYYKPYDYKWVYESDTKPYIEIVKKYKKNEDGSDNFEDIIIQSYSIRSTWSPSRGNNHIRCFATINGIEYEAIEDLNFGKAGTTGTDVTLALEFEGDVALALIEENQLNEKPLVISAFLYNSSGDIVPWPETVEISWGWKHEQDLIYIDKDNRTTVELKLNLDSEEDIRNNYSILTCTVKNYTDYNLISYLPIPIKTFAQASYIEGATEIIYDATGTPNYDKNIYKLFDKNSIQQKDIEWHIGVDGDNIYAPTLKEKDGSKALSANPFYVKDVSDKVCVYGIYNDLIYWSQPILIMEGQYGFSMLNEWDGTMQINEENGTILSTMLGAGTKNSDNTFTGVLIGDIEKGTGNEMVEQIGVYGLQDGMITYSLTEDGKATFGKANSTGQIIIDGDKGIIQSGNYQTSNGKEGMMIELDKGHIDAYNFKLTSSKVIIDSTGGEAKDAYFKVFDEDKTLISIGEEDYYLQSLTGKTKIDLTNSTIYLESEENPLNSILLQTSTEPYFLVKGSYTPSGGAPTQKNIMLLGSNDYYLQSVDYSPQGYLTNSSGYILYKDKEGRIVYYNGSNYINNSTGSSIDFSGTDEKVAIYKGYYNDEGKPDTSKVTSEDRTAYTNYQKSIYPQMLIPQIDTSKTGAGMHINLGDGMIVGYDLFLQAYNKDDKNKILTISSADEYTPLKIGDKFRVNWDGSLVCDNITYLGTMAQKNGYVININDHFTVSAGGGCSSTGFSGPLYGNASSATKAKSVVNNGKASNGISIAGISSDGYLYSTFYTMQDILDLISAASYPAKFDELYSDFYKHKHSTSVLGKYYQSGTPINI